MRQYDDELRVLQQQAASAWKTEYGIFICKFRAGKSKD